MHQFNIYLQGRVTQQTQQLSFGFNLGRHQVQDHDFQRADILRHGALMSHNENVLRFQDFNGRQ